VGRIVADPHISCAPVKRYVGTNREALTAFTEEAARAGYEIVFVAADVADAPGAPFSSPLPVVREAFLPSGWALAMPKAALTFAAGGAK
jgi:hypothetical protein